MSVTAVVGANWGDEGKGKLIDMLAEQAQYVVRFQGGGNAGHTIINQFGKFALHLLPSGVFYPHVKNVIGPGVALNMEQLLQERAALQTRNVPEHQLFISERTQVVLPYHPMMDELEELRLGDRKFGSTKQGIAPFYADKCLKVGLQIADLFEHDGASKRIEQVLERKNAELIHIYGQRPIQLKDIVDKLFAEAEQLRPLLCDTTTLLRNALAAGEQILVEGQLGALRDPDHGIHPYTTSSSTLAGYAAVGAGVAPQGIKRIIAVTKAYSSCVGAGPFVTELDERTGHELRQRGGDAGEYGALTGRPRRMGWLDLVATRYGCQLQGATELALTNLDVLGYLEQIPVCTAYLVESGRLETFPVSGILNKAKPEYVHLPGWLADITAIRLFAELPPEAQNYVRFVEQAIGVRIRYVSVGPRREQLIDRGDE